MADADSSTFVSTLDDVKINEIERVLRNADEADRRLRGAQSSISHIAQELAGQRTVRAEIAKLARWDAEKAAAPVVTRNAVLALNERVDCLLEATQTLVTATQSLADGQAAASRASATRWRYGMYVSVAVFLVAAATLVVALIK